MQHVRYSEVSLYNCWLSILVEYFSSETLTEKWVFYFQITFLRQLFQEILKFG